MKKHIHNFRFFSLNSSSHSDEITQRFKCTCGEFKEEIKKKDDKNDYDHWNYRVFKYKKGDGYGIHEAHYDKEGKVIGWTQEAIVVGDSIKELFEVLQMIANDIKRFPDVIEYD